MTFLVFVFILGLLIMVHEAGHYLMARRLGVRVEEFAFGFGPKLWGWKKGDTDFRICAVPLGGYVKMAGDERGQCRGGAEEYFSKPPSHRALIIVMGPLVNYLLAYLCFVVVFWMGAIDLDASLRALPARVGKVMPASVAQNAGIREGDVVVAIDGTPIANWPQMQEAVTASGGRELELRLMRAGSPVTLKVAPRLETARDLFGREHQAARLGIQQTAMDKPEHMVVRRYTFTGALRQAAVELWEVTAKTYMALWEIITGQRSAKEGVAGLVTMFVIIKVALGIGISYLIQIVGIISASLALFNVLPVIPLDGGHLALLGVEKARGRPLPPKVENAVNQAGFALIIALALFVFYIDFERIGLIDRVLGMFGR